MEGERSKELGKRVISKASHLHNALSPCGIGRLSRRRRGKYVENAAGIFLPLKRGQKRGRGPGDGENAAFRSELFSPSPGLKTM